MPQCACVFVCLSFHPDGSSKRTESIQLKININHSFGFQFMKCQYVHVFGILINAWTDIFIYTAYRSFHSWKGKHITESQGSGMKCCQANVLSAYTTQNSNKTELVVRLSAGIIASMLVLKLVHDFLFFRCSKNKYLSSEGFREIKILNKLHKRRIFMFLFHFHKNRLRFLACHRGGYLEIEFVYSILE